MNKAEYNRKMNALRRDEERCISEIGVLREKLDDTRKKQDAVFLAGWDE